VSGQTSATLRGYQRTFVWLVSGSSQLNTETIIKIDLVRSFVTNVVKVYNESKQTQAK